MYKTKTLTEKLQREMLNILNEMIMTKTCTIMISKIKESDEEINNLISSVMECAKKLEIDYKPGGGSTENHLIEFTAEILELDKT